MAEKVAGQGTSKRGSRETPERPIDFRESEKSSTANPPTQVLTENEYQDWVRRKVAGTVFKQLTATLSAIGVVGGGLVWWILNNQLNTKLDAVRNEIGLFSASITSKQQVDNAKILQLNAEAATELRKDVIVDIERQAETSVRRQRLWDRLGD